MAIIDHLLAPTDFLDYSVNACQFSEKIATSTNGIVDLLHVIPNCVLLDKIIRASAKDYQNINDEICPLIFNKARLKLNSYLKDYFQHESCGKNI